MQNFGVFLGCVYCMSVHIRVGMCVCVSVRVRMCVSEREEKIRTIFTGSTV